MTMILGIVICLIHSIESLDCLLSVPLFILTNYFLQFILFFFLLVDPLNFCTEAIKIENYHWSLLCVLHLRIIFSSFSFFTFLPFLIIFLFPSFFSFHRLSSLFFSPCSLFSLDTYVVLIYFLSHTDLYNYFYSFDLFIVWI